MARQRDYRAEYRRRQQLARQQGYPSYWQRRQTEAMAADLPRPARRKFISVAKEPPEGIPPARVRALWAEGHEAMINGDIERARQIADQLGVEPEEPTYPPESLFWYH